MHERRPAYILPSGSLTLMSLCQLPGWPVRRLTDIPCERKTEAQTMPRLPPPQTHIFSGSPLWVMTLSEGFEDGDEAVVVAGRAHGEAHELTPLHVAFEAAVADQHVVCYQPARELGRGEAVGYLAEEVVGLRGDDAQPGDGVHHAAEAFAFGYEAAAGLGVAVLIFAEYLHVELSE